MFSRASADQTWPIQPHSRPEPKLDKLSRCENWTGHARKEHRKSRSTSRRSRSRRRSSIAFGLERIGLIAIKAPILSCIILLALVIGAVFGIERIKIDDSLSQLFRSDTKEYQAIRGGDQALPVDRIRRAGRGRGQDAAGARQSRKAARPRHRPATRRRRARPDLAVLGAPGAGARQAAGGAVSRRTAGRRRLRQVHRDRQNQRDHPRQAAVGRRHAGADRAVARSRRSSAATGSNNDDRRNPQDHGRRSRRHRADRAAVRRAGHAARDPQRGRARRADLQHRSASSPAA